MILRPYQTIIATRSCNPLLWQKLYPAESLTMKDRTVTRNGTVHIIVPLTDAEMPSAEVPETSASAATAYRHRQGPPGRFRL